MAKATSSGNGAVVQHAGARRWCIRCRGQVCGAWLNSSPITKCSYGYDRGHSHIDATINLNAYEAWRVCPKFAADIVAVTADFNGQLWKLRLFSPYGL